MTEISAEQLETEQSMFVQTAQGIESDGAKLTLQGITPSTLYFSDRPQRVVGHMATTDFVDLWATGDNSFETDPPNAVLSFLEPGADVPATRSSCSRRRTSPATAISPTRSRCSRERSRRTRDPSRCSSTRSDGRFRPSPCAVLRRRERRRDRRGI